MCVWKLTIDDDMLLIDKERFDVIVCYSCRVTNGFIAKRRDGRYDVLHKFVLDKKEGVRRREIVV